jgi:muramoyltetrapeptide carboxypeptidase
MSESALKIGIVAPGSRIEESVAQKVKDEAAALYLDKPPEIYFHPQCFLSSRHFAGDDAARARAFIEFANDESYDALWFARGGYGSCRLVDDVLGEVSNAAKKKLYLGYSDTGALLAALYSRGFSRLAHGPMPVDITRAGGDEPVRRALRFLVEGARDTLEPTVSPTKKTAAFNITILSQVLGTPYQPDLSDHVVMLEEVSEQMYRIDRALFHITSNPEIRNVAGIMLGRCSDIPPNDPDFGQTEEGVAKHWCNHAGIPYLGRADIGHDTKNKIVPFGVLPG